ncbi:hypothetical protein CC80DRAFT_545367 [Byssothecium circinans]|uniref:Uncharacterized protein n=1 Tax=Byssothecium circinans TaxID=147558 RepID=A0A6A5U4Y0_9PLEO|nr:hypothetical protein CC80DRAFT_545367 [Byssothecium circinans]
MSLHNLINQELNDPSKPRLQRHVQKLASAAKISFAKQALLQDQNRFLSKINNEVKVRRSTRSVVLGKAKVMSYEDLEEARAKRATQEKAAADKGKGKRGRPRKNSAAQTTAEAEVVAISVDVEVDGHSSAPQNEWQLLESEVPTGVAALRRFVCEYRHTASYNLEQPETQGGDTVRDSISPQQKALSKSGKNATVQA